MSKRRNPSLYPDLTSMLNDPDSSLSSEGSRSDEEDDDEAGGDTSERLLSNYLTQTHKLNNMSWTTNQSSDSTFDDSQSFSEIFSNYYNQVFFELENFLNDPRSWCQRRVGELQNKILIWWSIVVLAILLVVCLIGLSNPQQKSDPFAKQRYRNLSRSIKQLLDDDKSLKPVEDLRRAFNYAVRALSGVEPEAASKPPVVILLAGAQSTVQQLMRKIGTTVRERTDVFVWEQEVNSSTSRIGLETTVFTALHSATPDQRQLLLMHDIDRLDNSAPLVLHSLADVESAPFKGIVIMASVSPPTSPNLPCSEQISSHLLSAWTSSDLSADQVHPIISRLVGVHVCIR